MEQLLPLARDRFTVELRNIDSRADWTEEFGIRIPVVRVGGVDICQYYLDREALQRALGG